MLKFKKVMPYVFKTLLLAGGVGSLATSCDKEPKPTAPTFKIVNLDFTAKRPLRATADDVNAALADGADSVYLVSDESFYIQARPGIHQARDDALELTAISPRVRGKGVINPTIEVAQELHSSTGPEFESCGFKFIPGYMR